MVKIWRDLYTVEKSTKLGKRSVYGPLIDFRRVPKIFTSGTPLNRGVMLSIILSLADKIVSSTPSGENVFPLYFVIFTRNLKFIVKMFLQKKYFIF